MGVPGFGFPVPRFEPATSNQQLSTSNQQLSYSKTLKLSNSNSSRTITRLMHLHRSSARVVHLFECFVPFQSNRRGAGYRRNGRNCRRCRFTWEMFFEDGSVSV